MISVKISTFLSTAWGILSSDLVGAQILLSKNHGENFKGPLIVCYLKDTHNLQIPSRVPPRNQSPSFT